MQIAAGEAFIADGSAGLKVVNYLPFDTQGVPPAVTITQAPANGSQVTEGSTVELGATITDDVQVRDVAVLVNGTVQSDSVTFPWNLSAVMPTIAANGSNQATIQIRATDTGGNVTTTAPITVQLVRDTTPPDLVNSDISQGIVLPRSFRTFIFDFSKPLDPTAVTSSDFTLIGPGNTVIAPQSIQLRSNNKEVQVTYAPLNVGSYTYQIDATKVTDTAGNVMGGSLVTTAFTVQVYSDIWTASGSGDWNTASNWSLGTVPSATDDVLVNLPAGETVSFASGSDSINSLTLESGGALTLSGGTLNIGATSIISGTFAQSGGTLGGSGNVTVTGAATLTGGFETGAGTTLLQNSATLGSAGSSGSIVLDGGRTLELAGTATAAGLYDYLYLSDSTGTATLKIDSGVTLNDQTTSSPGLYIGNSGGAGGTVTNAGTFQKTGTAATSTIATAFNNTGTVDVESGALAFSGNGADVGATYQGAGTVQFSGGTRTMDAASKITAAKTIVSGGQVTFGGSTLQTALSVSGGAMSVSAATASAFPSLNISSGTLTLSPSTTIGSLTQSGGTLGGAGNLTVTGVASLTGGFETGAGTTLLQNSATLGSAGTSGSIVLDGGRTLELAGTATAAGLYDYLYLSDSTGTATLKIDSGATLNDQTTSSPGLTIGNSGGAGGSVTNAGTFQKTGSAATSTVAITFNNTGTVDVESGALAFSGNGADVGATYQGAGTVQFSGGTRTMDAASKITAAKTIVSGGQVTFGGSTLQTNLSVTGGTLNVAAAATASGLTQSAGTLGGAGTLTVTGAAALTGGTETGSGTTLLQGGVTLGAAGSSNAVFFDGGRTLELAGAATVAGTNDGLYLSDSTGTATLKIDSGATLNDQTTSVGLTIGNNGGAGGSVTNAGTFQKTGSAATSTVATAFNNTGTVDVESGALAFSGNGADVGATYQGAGTVQFSGGTRTMDAASKITAAKTIVSGGQVTFGGSTLQMNLSVTGGTLNVAVAATASGLTQSAGTLGSAGTLTVTGAAALTGGTETGSGTTLLQGGVTLGAAGSSNAIFFDGGRTLELAGAATVAGTNDGLYLSDSTGTATLKIDSGATLNDQTTSVGLTIGNNGGAGGSVTNAGTFKKTGLAATSTVATAFNNTGTVDVESGTLSFSNITVAIFASA